MEVPVEKIVEKIVEVPVKKEFLPVEDYFENKDYDILEKKEDNIVDSTEEQPKRLTYTNRNGGSLRIDRF